MSSSYTVQDHDVKIKTDSSDKSVKRRNLIIAVVIIVVLIILVAVPLSIVLSRDESTEALPNRLAEYPLILISADGFRPDYLTRGLTPNIKQLGKEGVRAEFMLAQFPTKTFPNHYSIVTGLYPESHGIVFNSFYDPVLRKQFSVPKSRHPAFWKSGEPIWVTAKKNNMKTASYYWVGSEVEGLRPTYYRVYNQSVPFPARVEQVLDWLRLPREDRPSFITLYFHQPDYNGHGYGPDSDGVKEPLRVVDKAIGQLLNGLDDMNLTDSVNVILLSDHGMSAVNCNDTIFLDKYGVLANELFINNLGPVASFNTRKSRNRQRVFEKIKCVNDSFQAFYKENLPKRMHFSNNRRIDDIIVLADLNELLSVNSTAPQRSFCERGAHGYDNIASDMHTIFLARGPSFKKGKVVEYFSNVEVYNLLAELLICKPRSSPVTALLGIKPAPNNGTIGSLNRLLVSEALQNVSIPEPKGDGNNFRTDICQFPSDDEFARRSKSYKCYYCKVSEENLTKIDKEFNISAEEAKDYQAFHLPWGVPQGGAGVQGCLMTQPHFVIGYSTYLRIPLWTAHHVNGTLSSQRMPRKNCFRADVRLRQDETADCKSYYKSGFHRGHLVPNGNLDYHITASTSTFTFANVVPQYPKFNRDIWLGLENLVRQWAEKYEEVYVTSGSIFDADENGVRDDDKAPKQRTHNKAENPAIPTHFYKIITRCDPGKKSEFPIPGCNGSLRVISFILRHTDEKCSLYQDDMILSQNVARVKDIELLTGINFFPNLPPQLQAEIKTFLPVQLWK